jgi:hypothetical protein
VKAAAKPNAGTPDSREKNVAFLYCDIVSIIYPCRMISDQPPRPTWRATAAAVVEELFPCTARDAWDGLLDLRGKLLHGGTCEEVLEEFAASRRLLEEDHYLPFYRLRRLIAGHLRLEGESGVTLESLLRNKAFNVRRWQTLRSSRRVVEGV